MALKITISESLFRGWLGVWVAIRLIFAGSINGGGSRRGGQAGMCNGEQEVRWYQERNNLVTSGTKNAVV